MSEWDQFLAWWSKEMHEPIDPDPTATPQVVYKMCAWSAWNARAKTHAPEERVSDFEQRTRNAAESAGVDWMGDDPAAEMLDEIKFLREKLRG